MATVLSHARGVEFEAAGRRRWAAWAALAVLLAAEVLTLTGRFDAQALVSRGGVWGRILGSARYLPQGLTALAAAGLVFGLGFGGVRSRVASPARVANGHRPRFRAAAPSWPFLALHLAAYAVLVALTKAVWEGPAGRSPFAPAWAAAWVLAGLATLIFWARAGQPWGEWLDLSRRGWASGVLPAAAAVAAGACLAGRLTGGLGDARPLARATLWVVRGLLGLVYRDVVFRPSEAVVGTPGFFVEVAPQCSGYEGIGLIWAFLAVYLWFFRRELRFPQALLLLPAGTAVIWLANAVRIALLVAIGSSVSPSVALGGFHSQAGWLAFNAVALGLVAASRRGRVFGKPAGADVEADPGRDVEVARAVEPVAAVSPTLAYLGPLLALVGSVMFTAALSPATGFDALYPVRVVAVAAALLALRRGYAGWSWPRSFPWAGAGLGVAAFAVWMALEPAASASAPDLAGGLARLSKPLAALWLVFRVVGSVVTVPVAEELAFRGYVTRRLIAADFTAVAPGRFTALSFVVSSLAFGALHGRWFAGTLAGMLYALAYSRRGSLSDAVAAHATTNALIAAYVLATGAWGLWV